MIDRVIQAISRHKMLPPGTRVIAAVSGGADSVCLLHLLREVGANLTGIAHFNHHLRGEESDEDERFVAHLAARFDLPFYKSEARHVVGNLEQEARRARRGFFLQLIKDGAADRIALGHTLDDQAETVLFRILRGSGLSGLAGIHPITEDGIIRPLIDVRREEIREYLRSRTIGWREDSSNLDSRFARNRIRRELLPQLRREWNPQIDRALAQLADLAFEEEGYWGNCGSSWPATEGGIEISSEMFKSAPRAVARRFLRSAIQKLKGDLLGIEFDHIEQIVDMKPGRVRLPGVTATRSFSWVRLATSPDPVLEPIQLNLSETYETLGLRLEIGETAADGCVNLKVDLAEPIVLRGWKPGDHYRPVGKSRDQKLKEMFQRARVPSWRRPAWPILESEGKILWARDFGPAEEFAVSGNSGPVLRIWDRRHESERLSSQ